MNMIAKLLKFVDDSKVIAPVENDNDVEKQMEAASYSGHRQSNLQIL